MNRMQSQIATQQAVSKSAPSGDEKLEGVVVAGSWIASEGVCQVLIGDTVGYENNFFNDGGMNQPLMPVCRIINPAIGDQYAPVGGEGVVAWVAQCGWVCEFLHYPGDSSPVPAGERWIQHRSAADPSTVTYDSSVNLTNDGPTPGDSLGGTYTGGTGAITQSQTASGARSTINDTAQSIEHITAGLLTIAQLDQVKQIVHSVVAGQLETIIDGIAQKITHQASPSVYSSIDAIGEEIAHVVPAGTGKIGLGALFEDLPSASAAINQNILSTFGDNVNQFGLANLQALVTLFQNAGAITAPQASTIIAGIILSWLTKVGIPDGSPIVRLAS